MTGVQRWLTAILLALVASSASLAADAAQRVYLGDALRDGDVDAEDMNGAYAKSLLGRGGVGRAVMPPWRGGTAYVSLFGFVQTSPLVGAREVGAGLVVGWPFDRVAPGRADGVGARRIADGPPRPLPVRASVPAPMLPPAEPAEAPPLVLTPALARATVRAALRASGLGETDARMDAMASRARWSAVLPETRIRAMRNEDERASVESNSDASKLKDSAGAGLGLEARLTWRLDRLVFAEEETALERLRLERYDARMRMTSKVLEALVHWSRASFEAQSGEAAAVARLVEAEATLDVLTAGWFTAARATRVLVLPPLPPVEETGKREAPAPAPKDAPPRGRDAG